MIRTICAAVAAFMLIAPIASTGTMAAEKKLTPQQQKMKDCGAKWQEHKKAKKVKGKTEYQKFLSGCLKKT